MKEFGFASVVASGLAAAVLGLAGPAQDDIGHHDWVQDIQKRATVGGFSDREEEEFLLHYGPKKVRKVIKERRKAREQAQATSAGQTS
jgi:hypothetical protein